MNRFSTACNHVMCLGKLLNHIPTRTTYKCAALFISLWIFSNPLFAKPEIIVASEGFTNKALHTEFSVYANSEKGTSKITLDRNNLPSSIKFVDKGQGEARFIWKSPELGKYTLILHADDGDSKEIIKFPLVVGDYGYPKENDGEMIMPEFPPLKGTPVIHVSTSGSARNFGSFESPTDIKTALNTARRLSLTAAQPIYILFKRGDHWKGKSAFVINEPLKGKRHAPIVFGAYGKGDDPIFDRLFSRTDIEYLHFQDLVFHKVLVYSNRIKAGRGHMPGSTVPSLDLIARHTVQRLRFYHCTSIGGGFAFLNIYANAGRGSRIPYPNGWWGGGPLAGLIRDIEISYSSFLNIKNGDTPDAINFNAPDRGIWIHHNKFVNSKEEHIDIAGGRSHIVEYNFAIGSTTNNGIKFHSQYSLLTDTVIRHNTVLFAGGWNTLRPGSRGNAFAALNIMGCQIHYNNFISRYAAAIGDDNRTDDRGYYGVFAGNQIDHNIYRGTTQLLGQHNNTINYITLRNKFSDNMYATWPDSRTLIRYWDSGTSNRPLVGTKIDKKNFNKWTELYVTNEKITNDSELRSFFVNPQLPSNPNIAIDINTPGDWTRVVSEE